MEAEQPPPVNEEYDPTENDEKVLKVLQKGRANPLHIREESGLAKQRVNESLERLRSAGWVRKVTRGLYELVNDPRGGNTNNTLSFTPLGSKNVSYGPSSRADAAFVLRVGTEDGTVELHLDEDEMYELWTEVQHTPWPDTLDEQEEAGRLRQRLVDLAMGADEEMLRDALNALDPHWQER